MAIGRVARSGEGAICVPTIPPSRTRIGAAVCPKHCARVSTIRVRYLCIKVSLTTNTHSDLIESYIGIAAKAEPLHRLHLCEKIKKGTDHASCAINFVQLLPFPAGGHQPESPALRSCPHDRRIHRFYLPLRSWVTRQSTAWNTFLGR